MVLSRKYIPGERFVKKKLELASVMGMDVEKVWSSLSNTLDLVKN